MHMHRELSTRTFHFESVFHSSPVSVQQTVEKSLFLNYFYKHCMHRVMAPLMAQTAAERVSNGKGTGGKACIGIYISHELTTLKWGSHDGHMSS